MIFRETSLAGSYEVLFEPQMDSRGWFARTYCKDEFGKIGFNGQWLQMNHSFTSQMGTIRGMHFQRPPFREVKLVRCIAGAVLDVIIDLRADSPTFLRYESVTLSPAARNSLFIPEGFAHGFQALTDNVELIYLHSAVYAAGYEGGLRFDDPKLNVQWPLPVTLMSERDATHPLIDNNFKGI